MGHEGGGLRYHCMKVWIYNIFTTDQMWYKYVSKYGICDINTVVNIKDSFTTVLMSHVPYLLTHLHHICKVVNIL